MSTAAKKRSAGFFFKAICLPAFLFVLLSGGSFGKISETGQTLRLRSGHALTVAIDREYAPYEFVSEAGEVTGFIPALLRAFADQSGSSITFIPMDWPEAVAALQGGRVDLISMIRTPERERLFQFSQPHSVIAQAIFRSAKAPGIHDLPSLAGHRVALQDKDISEEKLAGRTDFLRKQVPCKEEGFMLLQSGEVDAFLASEQAGLRFIRRYALQEHVELAAVGLFPQDYCFAARKGNSVLIEELDRFLASFRASGSYTKIFLEWFSDRQERSWFVRHQKKVFWGVAGLAGAVLTIVLWNMTLRRTVARQTADLFRSNELLLRREDHIRLLLNSTAEAIYGLDTEGRCTFCNAAFLRQLSYQREEDITGKVVHEMIHHTRPDGSPYPFEKCIAHRGFLKGEPSHADDELFFRPDGSSFPVEYWSYPIVKDMAVTGAVVTFIDITARKEAEAAVKESEERYRTLVDNIDLGITLIDRNHRIIMINKAQAGLFHGLIDDFTGKYCYQEFEKRRDICPHCPGKTALSNGQAAEVITEGLRDDGTRFTVRIRAFPMTGSEKLAGSFIEVVEDITEQKRLQDELDLHRRHLEEEVTQRTAELRAKNDELESINRLFVGRELRMAELKKRISELGGDCSSRQKDSGR